MLDKNSRFLCVSFNKLWKSQVVMQKFCKQYVKNRQKLQNTFFRQQSSYLLYFDLRLRFVFFYFQQTHCHDFNQTRTECRRTKTVTNRRLNLCRDSHNFASPFSFFGRAFYICTVTAPTVLLMHKNKHRAQIGPRNKHECVRTLFKCTVLINIFLNS